MCGVKIVVALLTLAAFGCRDSVETRIAQEIARVDASLQASEKAKLNDEIAELPKMYREALD